MKAVLLNSFLVSTLLFALPEPVASIQRSDQLSIASISANGETLMQGEGQVSTDDEVEAMSVSAAGDVQLQGKEDAAKPAKAKKPHLTAATLRRVFDDADADHDAKLEGSEIETLNDHYDPRSDFDWHTYTGDDDAHLDFDEFSAAAAARVNMGPRPLCEALIVKATCSSWNAGTSEHYGTAADSDPNIVHLEELATILSTPANQVKSFLHEISVTNAETDSGALAAGAFAFSCDDLCHKVVASIPEDCRPLASDQGCRTSDDGTIVCDRDMSDIGYDLEEVDHPGIHGDPNEKEDENETDDQDPPPEVPQGSPSSPSLLELPIVTNHPVTSPNQIAHTLAMQYRKVKHTWVGYSNADMKVTIANHFRVYPAGHRQKQAAGAALSETSGRRRRRRQFTVAHVANFEDDAYSWLTQTINEVNGNNNDIKGKMRKYFKYDSGSTRTEVIQTLNEINADMRHMHIIVESSCEGSLASAVAYVRSCVNPCTKVKWGETSDHIGSCAYVPGEGCKMNWEMGTGNPVVHFCPGWGTQNNDFKTRAMIHEMAHHDPTDAGDFGYHQDTVEKLAQNDPSKALKNADSYALFAKDAGSRRRRGACFPGTAKVMTKDKGWRQLRDLKGSELIATSDMSTKEVKFEQYLADWHSEEEHKQVMNYIRLEHELGSLEVSALHFVNTAEYGLLPAGHIRIGEHLMATDGNLPFLKMSKVLSMGNVSKVGLYSPVTFSGALLVDGVHVSSYTADEFHAFLDKNAQEQLLKYVKGFNGINSIMHSLALPLRLSYYIGLPSLLQSASAWGIPGSSYLLRFFVPDQRNAIENTQESGQAAYVELMGKLVGGLINSMASQTSGVVV